MKRKINDTLLELICGILASGVLIEVIDLIVTGIYPQFAGLRVRFATGFWSGIVVAIALAAHMYRSIDRALDMQPKDAEGYMRRAYLLRTMIILLAAAAVHYLKFGYVMAYFVGVLCLKFGAFLQPLVHKLRERLRR